MTLDYIINPRYWPDMEAYIAEQKTTRSSFLYERIERINDTLYVGVRKQ